MSNEEQSDKLPEYIQEEMRNIDEIESALVEEILEEFQKIGIDTSEWEHKFGDGNFAAEFIAAGIKYHLEQLTAPEKPQTWPDLDYNKPPLTDYPQEGNTAERLRLSLEETKQQLIQAYHLKDYEFNNRKWLVGLIKSIVDEQKQNNHE